MTNHNYNSLANLAFDDIFDAGKCKNINCRDLSHPDSEWESYQCWGNSRECPRQDDLQAAMVPYLADVLRDLTNNDAALESILEALKANSMEQLGEVINRNLY